jgi:hypothetical protein
MHPGNHVLWGCSALRAILPQSPELCQDGDIWVLSTTGKKRKVGWVGGWQSCRFWWKGRVRWCNAKVSSFVAKFQGKVFTHFHAVAVKVTVVCRIHCLTGCEQSPWCKRKCWACSWLYTSPVSPFSVCPEPSMPFKHLHMAHAFFSECLSNHCQGLRHTFSKLHKIWNTLAVGSISSHQARHTTPNKRT